ncbi:MAG: PAS domain-containing protein [Phormidesmis sp. RL_2_1]|nr:PAS domain-containing protein [Phormidesmis sp. RL_2_1]
MQGIVFWVTLEAACSSVVTALFFIFTLYFTHRRQWLSAKRRALIWIIPIFNIGLVLTNHWHHWVWHDFTPVGNRVAFSQGAAYLWLAAWFYIYVLTGVLMVARAAIGPSTLYRQQALTVIVSACPPLIGGTLHVLELVPAGISLLPMSFLFTGLTYFTSLFRFRLFDLLPIARDTLIENMTDCVLVLDNEGRVIDLNPAAQQFTHRLAHQAGSSRSLAIPSIAGATTAGPGMTASGRSQLIGQSVNWVLGQWPSLLRHCKKMNLLRCW